ncbi:MAG: glycosyltransferase [Bacteroidota bacterium]
MSGPLQHLDKQAKARSAPLLECQTIHWNPKSWQPQRAISGTMLFAAKALGQLKGIALVEDDGLPAQCFKVANQEGLIFFDDQDQWYSPFALYPDRLDRYLAQIQPHLVLKLQYRAGAPYPWPSVASGYLYYHQDYLPQIKKGIKAAHRPIAVTARMRTGGYTIDRDDLTWMKDRQQVVEQAEQLGKEGWECRTGMTEKAAYFEELPQCQIGFNWQGFGRLNIRIMEYLSAGIVMLTQPLGAEWPLREDVVLEDEVHCLFCARPDDFGKVAKQLLRHPDQLERMRERVIELWEEKLKMEAYGRWLLKQIENAGN